MQKKRLIIIIVIFLMLVGTASVFAFDLLAQNVEFHPTDENWDVDNVKDALDNLGEYMNGMTQEARQYTHNYNYSVSLEDLFSSIKFCSDRERLNEALTNINYTNVFLTSASARLALDNCSPTISTNTSKAFASTAYSGYPASNAFDSDTGSYWGPTANISYQNQYIGYDFTTPVWVYKMIIIMSDGKQNTDYVLEASNDKTSNYVIIKSGLHQGGGTKTVIPNNYNQKYRYYRVRMLSTVAQSGNGNTIVSHIRFYGI